MIKFACVPALEAAGYTEKELVIFKTINIVI
jgi:hypothetical protein